EGVAFLKVQSADVKDMKLAADGQNLIDWAAREMPVLLLIRQRFAKEQPLKGIKVAACLHVTSETAILMLTLKAAGADIALCASNPLSTTDAVAAALVGQHSIKTYAIRGEDNDTYYQHIESALDHHPAMTMDDGADLVSVLHKKRESQIPEVIGGTEETTTGVIRLKRWPTTACCATRSSPSTRPTRSTCSTTGTALGSRRSTASSARPTCCWPASRWSS